MSNRTLPHPIWTAGYPETGVLRARVRLGRVLHKLGAMLDISRQRKDLAELDDRTLQDIGVSRAEVEREAGRRFWDVDL